MAQPSIRRNLMAAFLCGTLALAAGAQASQVQAAQGQTARSLRTASPSANPTVEWLGPVPTGLQPLNCPVGLWARPGIGPAQVVVDSGGKSLGTQVLELSFHNAARGVTGAEITVHGWTYGGRIVPAESSPGGPTVARTIKLPLAMAPQARASREILLRGFTSVRFLNLNALHYADGTIWRARPGRACAIVPSRYMPVDTMPAAR